MNTVIITVAGTATRFNKDTTVHTLKCLYYEGSPQETLLYGILKKSRPDDQFVIVGGYLYEQLGEYISVHCAEFASRIHLVYNEKFDTYGSGYSLILGIENIPEATDSVTFVEGDLFFDISSYHKLLVSQKDAITVNHDLIEASKAVAIVIDGQGHPHYIYDTKHTSLHFDKPFKAIYNSAQMWKFNDVIRLKSIVSNLNQSQIEGTNLEIIGGYFTPLTMQNIETITFCQWCNCNTVADYKSIFKK